MQYTVDTVLDYLNAQNFGKPIPEILNDIFDNEEYKKSQSYKKANYRFGLLSDLFSLLLTLSFLVFGPFGEGCC